MVLLHCGDCRTCRAYHTLPAAPTFTYLPRDALFDFQCPKPYLRRHFFFVRIAVMARCILPLPTGWYGRYVIWDMENPPMAVVFHWFYVAARHLYYAYARAPLPPYHTHLRGYALYWPYAFPTTPTHKRSGFARHARRWMFIHYDGDLPNRTLM